MPKVMNIETLLDMPKLLSNKIKNGTIGDLLDLVRQLNESKLLSKREFDIDEIMADYMINYHNDKTYRKIHRLYLIISKQITNMLFDKSPKVDHREWEKIQQLMHDIGFQIFKINKDGEREGIELKVSDYSQKLKDGHEVVVERKSNDFFSSIFDGRLFEQISDISDDENIIIGFLIIDKSLSDLLSMARENNISENVVFGTLASCCLRGYPPIFTDNIDNFSKIVDKIFEKSYDGKERVLLPKLAVGKGDNIITFPGIDVVIGRRLYEYFGSIKAIVNADKESLKNVKGVGDKLADKIMSLVN